MRTTRDQFGDRPAAAFELAAHLLRTHPDDNRRSAHEDLAAAAPASDPRMTGPKWIEAIEPLLNPANATVHARLAIVGLALADIDLGRWMLERGLLQAIEAELREPARTELSPAGLRIRDALSGAPLPGYVPDSTAGRDLLGIERDVASFAAILAARDNEPPVSVGLFGRWGTGKSFFMERMREQIDALGKENPDVYCSNVVQIKFNAWHYIDANLWASLAAHIFERLASHGQAPGRAGTDAATENLLLNLRTTGELVARKVDEHADAEKRREEVEVELAQIEDKRKGERGELRVLDVGTLAEAVDASDEIRSKLEAAQGSLGIDAKVAQGVLEVGRWRSGRGIGRRLAAAWRYLWARPIRAAAVIVVVAAGAALAIFGGGLAATAIGLAAPAVAIIIAVLQAAAPLGQLLDSVEQSRRTRAEELRAEQHELERRADRERDELRVAREQERQAQRELDKATSGTALRRFIEERATSDRYSRQLGIIASVQRDFERLSELMSSSEPGETPKDESGRALPGIDRIILYVDDLDRCPAETVVDVLEAVHLLLAFPLFVAVVGVDPGWLERALTEKRLKSEEVMSTPRDYLEKIFQIPFVLQPMHSEGYSRLVGAMLPTRAPAVLPTDGADGGEPVGEDVGQEDDAMPRDTEGPAGFTIVDEPVAVAPANLTIDPPELEALMAVGPLIPTPRAAKRLINAYRFIRAGVPPSELNAFVGYGEEPGSYHAVVLMLTALIAFPGEAPSFFEEIGSDQHLSWDQLIGAGQTGSTDDHATLVILALGPVASCGGNYLLSNFSRWLPRVERFSFGL